MSRLADDLNDEFAGEPEPMQPERALACSVLLGALHDVKDPKHQASVEAWAGTKDFLFWCELAGIPDGAIERLERCLRGTCPIYELDISKR